jgi:two-component system, OmpR family, phosphate regulon sensor histidine kinase PhoR
MEPVAWLAAGAVVGACCAAWVVARRARRVTLALLADRLRRRRARHRLVDDEARRLSVLLDRTFSAVNIGLIHIDRDMRIRAANPTACDWFDLDPVAWPTLMAATASADLRDAVETALHDGGGEGATARVAIRQRVYRVNVSALPDGTALLALRDDTDVEQLARARRDLVANISHDLRTPLTSIGLLTETLLGRAGADADQRQAVLARLQEQVGVLTEMADGLMELNRLESGRAILQLRPEHLITLVGEAADALWPQLAERNLSVVPGAPDDLWVLVDAPQFHRVLANLLDNARRFSPHGGAIRVGAEWREGEEMVEVWVSDDGPGIAPGEADRVFERFYRADPARSGPGKGLGLAIARHVVAGHGGRMWVDLAAEKGTTIRFTLPVAQSPSPDGVARS